MHRDSKYLPKGHCEQASENMNVLQVPPIKPTVINANVIQSQADRSLVGAIPLILKVRQLRDLG